jgi:hypothetical protein
MAELKTKVTKASPKKFIDSIADPEVRADCKRIAAIMAKASGEKAEMWGTSIVGYGRYFYMGASGRGGEWMQVAFSPRKNAISLYLTSGFAGFDAKLAKLGKHTRGGGCLYVKRLSDVHVPTLESIIKASVKHVRNGRGVGAREKT